MYRCRCYVVFWFFFFKQKTAYEMRISDWSSDVCSSDLIAGGAIQIELDRVGVDQRRGDFAEPFLDAEATLKVAAEQLDGERAGDILGAAARRLAFPARLDAGRHRDRPRPQMEQVALDLDAPGIQLGDRPGILRPRDIGDGLGRGVGLADRGIGRAQV